MARDVEIVRDVFIADFQVTAEAAADLVDFIGDGVCPLCKTENSQFEDLPSAGQTTTYRCSECCIDITVESWEA